MPTLLRTEGFRFFFSSNEGRRELTFQHQAVFVEQWNEHFRR